MDRRTTLAIALCFLIYLGWQKYYLEPRALSQSAQNAVVNTQTTGATAEAPPSAVSQQTAALSSGPKTPAVPEQHLMLSNHVGDAQVSNGPDLFTNWDLKTYRLGISPDTAAVNLSSVTNRSGQVDMAFDDAEFAYLSNVKGQLVPTAGGGGALWTYEDSKVKITKELTGGDKDYIGVNINAEFKGKRPNNIFLSLSSQGIESDPEAKDRQLVYWTNNAIERVNIKGSIDLKDVTTPVKWVGATNRYFLMAMIANGDYEPKGLIQPLGPALARASLRYPLSGNSISIPLKVYFGPKEIDVLKSVEPTLNHTIDFGWFELFAYPLLTLLRWLHQFVRNYGVAIIVLTILLKLVTYPLTYKSMKSMKEMAKLQPQLAKLREKYKGDKEALNREMMGLMKNHGYNPVAGCLPIVIQMPVFFALYRVLYSSIELFHTPFMFWIHDLSKPDQFYVTPVLLSLTMFIQQKLTPNAAADPAQQKMMQFMPLIFGAFMLGLPSGLTLYMLVNALASIVQQLYLNKKLDPGKNVPIVLARAP